MYIKLACLALVLFGVASATSENRLVGGTPTTIREFPYIVAITYHYPSIGLTIQRCVGSLVSSWHVLTSSFCFTGANLNNMLVRAGSSYSLSGGIEVPIRSVVQHPDYEAAPRTADLAVVFLANALPITGDINVLFIPAPGTYIPDGQEVKIVSWGFESEPGPGSVQLNSLKSILLSKIPLDACEAIYENSEGVSIDEAVICTNAIGRGTCFGDSGAPAVIGDVLVGVSSFYQECGNDNYPDVLTRIDKYTDWIVQVATAPNREGTPLKTAKVY
ncbi:unnamed protein product [Diatraea saccharalis]|uniref:Peptidase S1 domain-containing protein n=1 Tax=Diatraea saccharalis TaxID=40085 RepID=A0A9N9RGJ8_9NEOP|nr:unnamed protein product [Diatraea saccharalis]